MKRESRRDPLLLELVAAIGAGNIELGPIHDDQYYVHGMCDEKGRVRINLASVAVNTALHEVLHRMRPKFSERAVRSRVGKLMAQLSDAEVDRLYEVILSTAVVSKKIATL